MSPTKEERQQEILQAALAAFSENGYAKTTMDDIVRRSGLSKGTLYWHFRNKQDLFVSTIRIAFQEIDEQLAALVHQKAPADDRLRSFFLQAGQFIENNKHIVGLLADAFFQAYQIEEAMDTMRTLYQNYIASIEMIIRQGIEAGEFREIDPHAAAIALMAGGDGVALYMLMDTHWDMEGAFVMIVDLILRGLHKE